MSKRIQKGNLQTWRKTKRRKQSLLTLSLAMATVISLSVTFPVKAEEVKMEEEAETQQQEAKIDDAEVEAESTEEEKIKDGESENTEEGQNEEITKEKIEEKASEESKPVNLEEGQERDTQEEKTDEVVPENRKEREMVNTPESEKNMPTKRIRLLTVEDLDGNALSGARYTLEKRVNDVYEEIAEKTNFSVSKEGFDLGELESGEYRLTEKVTPEGYITSGKPIEFKITQDSVSILNEEDGAQLITAGDGTYILMVYNALSYGINICLPSTGGIGTGGYVRSGFLILIAATGYLLWGKEKIKR